MFSNPVARSLRSAARKSGFLVWLVGAYRRTFRPNYEWAFDRVLMQSIGPEDVIWDIGANEGVYTRKFAEKASRVIAFEPSPSSVVRITRNIADLTNARVEPVALSRESGEAKFYERTDGYSVANALDVASDVEATEHIVQVRRADEFPCPTKAKIDVEGYELEVLEGMTDHLRNPTLKALFIEVHFGILERRGLADAPAKIEKMLKLAGFRLRWSDPSHLFATRA